MRITLPAIIFDRLPDGSVGSVAMVVPVQASKGDVSLYEFDGLDEIAHGVYERRSGSATRAINVRIAQLRADELIEHQPIDPRDVDIACRAASSAIDELRAWAKDNGIATTVLCTDTRIEGPKQ